MSNLPNTHIHTYTHAHRHKHTGLMRGDRMVVVMAMPSRDFFFFFWPYWRPVDGRWETRHAPLRTEKDTKPDLCCASV